MMRLHLVVEGQTEETFVNSVLCDHLGGSNISVDVHCVTTTRRRGKPRRGGLTRYAHLRRDLEIWIKQEQKNADCVFSTMVDLYGLPTDFPAYAECRKQPDAYARVEALEKALAKDFNDYSRLIPYIQLHEFEAILFSDPACFSTYFSDRTAAICELEAIASEFESPELINDGENTCPSRRIVAHLPEYEGAKVSAGPLIAGKIGIPTIRARCPHFDGWLTRLESLEGPQVQ